MADPAIQSAKELLRRVGLSTTFNDDDLRDIASGSASRSTTSSPPSSGSDGRLGQSHSRLSLPSEILDELNSPAALPTRGVGRSAVGGLNAPSDTLRHEYENRLERLTEEVSNAHHERRLLEIDCARRVRTLEEEVHNLKEHHHAQMASARAAQTSAEVTAQQLREKLDVAMSNFTDMNISSSMYEELCNQPPSILSLRGFILKRVYEHNKTAREQLERCRLELEQTRDAAKQTETELDKRCREALHRAQVAEAREAGAKEQIGLLEATIQRLQSNLSDAMRQIDTIHSKGVAYDAVDSKRREMEMLHEKDAQVIAAQAASLEVAKADRNSAVHRCEELQMKVELLVADKSTLSSSLEESRLTNKRLQDEVQHLQLKLSDAIKQRDAFQDQLVKVHTESRAWSDDRLQSEITRLREQSARDLDELRLQTRESYEREVRALRDARAELIGEVQRLQSRIESLTAQLDETHRNAKYENADNLTVLAETRGALKVKAFEAERLAIVNAELQDSVRRLNAECDLLREKVSVIQTEYARLDASTEKNRLHLESALASEKEKVLQYEKLEAELDSAIDAAGRAEHEGVQTTGLVDSALMAQLGTSTPINMRRRVRQAVLLTKELLRAQEDISVLKRQLSETQTQLHGALDSEANLRLQLEAVQGPQEYLISQIREKDSAMKNLKEQLDDCKSQLGFTRSTLQQVNDAKITAESDLRRLASTRSELSSLLEVVKKAISLKSAATVESKSPEASDRNIGDVNNLLSVFNSLLAVGQATAHRTTASGPLSASELHHPVVSTATTPLGTASTRTTPPVGKGDKATPPRSSEGHFQGTSPVSNSPPEFPRYDLRTIDGQGRVQFSAEMPHAEGITYVAPRGGAQSGSIGTTPSRPRWHRRLYE